jgi:hypothetical protein
VTAANTAQGDGGTVERDRCCTGSRRSIMLELDLNGRVLSLSNEEARLLRDAAAREAGHSEAARNLSLLLDRGLKEHRRLALQRGEQRALRSLVEADPEFERLRIALTND